MPVEVEQWPEIRRMHLVKHLAIKEIARAHRPRSKDDPQGDPLARAAALPARAKARRILLPSAAELTSAAKICRGKPTGDRDHEKGLVIPRPHQDSNRRTYQQVKVCIAEFT